MKIKNEKKIVSNQIKVDEVSNKAFDYVNDFRTKSDYMKLDFVEEAYLAAMEISNNKDESLLSFRQAPERQKVVNSNYYSVQYNFVYEINGLTVNDFKAKFNCVYFIKNIIKSDKYDVGAIGCSKNYYTLILLNEKVGSNLNKIFKDILF